MDRAWFRPQWHIYRPAAWQGWLVVGVCAAFLLQTFIAIDARSHSVSDTLYGIFPYWLPALLLLERIAAATSRR